MRKDDLRLIRRPSRPAVALLGRQLDQVRANGEDGVELRSGASGEGAEGLEEEPLAIGRPMRIPRLQFPPRCQLLKTSAITVDDEQLCWLLGTSVLKRGCINSRSIGNFEPILIGLRLGT
jgi:hypothetical protein